MTVMKIALFALFFQFILTFHLLASQISVSGNVSGVWDVDTVLVTDNIVIPNGSTLSIVPGSLIFFQGHFFLKVEGRLLAQGIQSDTIRFSVPDTTGFTDLFSPAGSWNGIWFHQSDNQNDSSLFEYCSFEFGKAIGSDSTHWYGGAVCIRESSKIRFSNCHFVNNRAFKNGGAVYVRKAAPRFQYCHFENNHCGLDTLFGYGGALCLEYSDSWVYRNSFIQNSSTGVGGGISFEFSDPRIESNRISGNFSAIGGGMSSLRSSGGQPVVNNLITGNSGYFFGGGMAFIESSTRCVNNTVADNYSGAGGGFFINFTSSPVIYNTVLWGNNATGGSGHQVYIWDSFSAPEFYHCLVGGGLQGIEGTGGGAGFIGVFENCYDEDPLFIGSGSDPYMHDIISVCTNNGSPDTTGLLLPLNDLIGAPRIFAGAIDIGAYEVMYLSDDQALKPSEAYKIHVYPVPFRQVVNVHFTLEAEKLVIIVVYDQMGRVAGTLQNGFLKRGDHAFVFEPSERSVQSKSPVTYFLQMKVGDFVYNYKLLRVD
jgi:predicted outer membrane repeat protein